MSAATEQGRDETAVESDFAHQSEQTTLPDGLICLVMLARFHALAVDPAQLIHDFAGPGGTFGVVEILLAAKQLGLKAKRTRIKKGRLKYAPLPAIGIADDGSHFILASITETAVDESGPTSRLQILIQSPAEDGPKLLSMQELQERWNGELILLASRASVAGDLARFDFSWFIPAIVKYRKLLGEVLLASFVLQVFSLFTPLFFQVIMDKVLVNKAFSTLDVIAAGILLISVFEVLLTALRSYVFAHTTSRIDVELGARLFNHLSHLPLSWFKARRVGDTVARARELEHIRSFLTGNALTVLLDVLFSVVFIGVMCWYSLKLTLVVVISIPLYALISALMTPLLRVRLQEKFNRSAESHSFLVESVAAIETVKTMSVEPQFGRRWDNQLAAYVAAGFRANSLSIFAGAGISLISKLVTVATMWIGAHLVISGKMTVGQLVAFNMLAGRVSDPIMRLAQLWTDFQQTGISMQRLGDILNTRTEIGNGRESLPPIVGGISFEKVCFRYRPDSAEVLSDINIEINPGEVIGIVGRSGSGKSTLTKLIQRLYFPERGSIRIDGVDLALAGTTWLRRQIGVVLQENILFNRSIRENIAIADPGMPMEAVVYAAQLAGAHDFILELAEGFDTMVGEHGSTLSGGQRQRIAIARALISNPRILIWDEATSALDYESERIIRQNMQAICHGRTVIIIAHRLSAVRDAHRIIVMERGRIVEEGNPKDLLANPDGHFSYLHALQMG